MESLFSSKLLSAMLLRTLIVCAAYSSSSADASTYFEESGQSIPLRYSEYKGYNPVVVSTLDANADGRIDLVFHFWSSLEGLSGDLLNSPPPNFLKIFVQAEDGSFTDQTRFIMGEDKPSLGGASRHVVKGDFNGDEQQDLVFAMNWEDARKVEDSNHLSAQLAAVLSTTSGYEIKLFGTPSWYHSLGVGVDQMGRQFVTGNGFSGEFAAELWRFNEANEPVQVAAQGIEIPPNAFEFLSQGSDAGTDLLLRNANYPDMFGIYAYQRESSVWQLKDQLAKPYESLGDISFLGWNATEYGSAAVVDINGYASLEGGGSSYAKSCSIRLYPQALPIAVFKVSSAFIPKWGELDSITDSETVTLNTLVGFGFKDSKITKDLLHIENEVVETNTNFFDCHDVDGDGYDDITMYPYRRLPLIYINNQSGGFYKLEDSRVPNVLDPSVWSYGSIVPFSSMLRDFTGDGIPDLLFWPANGIPADDPGNEFGEFIDFKVFKGLKRLTKNAIDSDNDTISDENEIRRGLDPLASDSDGDGFLDSIDTYPIDAGESVDTDGDGVGDNADAFPNDASETIDTDSDGIGNNADSDDDGDGFSDEQETTYGTDPLSKFSCRTGCFSFDIDNNASLAALADGLLVIRHLFGFTGDTLIASATDASAMRNSADDISAYLTAAESELDIDGSGDVTALTDGLLLIRYLFGFSGDSLVNGALGTSATRTTPTEIEDYVRARVPSS